MRRIGAAIAVALGIGLFPAVAHADTTVVVPGTAFPSTSTYLTYFGCSDLFHADARGPAVRVTRDPAAPLGRHATELEMPGAGTASGPVSLVGSVADATSRLSVDAPAGTSGVAYAWYVSSELEPGQVWAGRARLSAGAGWQTVDAAAATYTWTRLDAATGKVRQRLGRASLTAFTARHGDGPGYLLSGFGCDGKPFELDALQSGTPGQVTTYDLEGWAVSTSIAPSVTEVAPGERVRITGSSVDPGGRVMGAALQLEARPEGAAGFTPVGAPVAAGADGTVATTVAPEATTEYRWAFPETGYADAHRSPVVRVVVTKPAPTPTPQTPTPTPSATPQSPSPTPTTTSPPPSPPSPTASPTTKPTASPTATQSSSPTAEPATSPSPTASGETPQG